MTKGLLFSIVGLVLAFVVMAGVAYAQTASPTPSPTTGSTPTTTVTPTPTPLSVSVPSAAPSTGLGGLAR